VWHRLLGQFDVSSNRLGPNVHFFLLLHGMINVSLRPEEDAQPYTRFLPKAVALELRENSC
jgi:hypothetical protein